VFALPAFYPGKTKMKIPAFQIFINDIRDKRAPVTKSLLIAFFPDTFQFFIMILDTKKVYTFPVNPWFIVSLYTAL